MTTYTNKGRLFRSDGRPDRTSDYFGTIDIDGVEYKIAGWLTKAKGDRTFIALAVESKDDRRRRIERAEDWARRKTQEQQRKQHREYVVNRKAVRLEAIAKLRAIAQEHPEAGDLADTIEKGMDDKGDFLPGTREVWMRARNLHRKCTGADLV